MESTTPDWDSVYQAMTEPVRRAALESVLDGGTKVSVDDIAADICGDDADEKTVARTAASLYHVHLPVLADAGLVTYDHDSKYAQPTETAGRLPLFVMRPHLTTAEPSGRGQRAGD